MQQTSSKLLPARTHHLSHGNHIQRHRQATKHAAQLSKQVALQVKQATLQVKATLQTAASRPEPKQRLRRQRENAPAASEGTTDEQIRQLVALSFEPHCLETPWDEHLVQLSTPRIDCLPLADGSMDLTTWVNQLPLKALKQWIQYPDMPQHLLAALNSRIQPFTPPVPKPQQPASATPAETAEALQLLEELHALISSVSVPSCPDGSGTGAPPPKSPSTPTASPERSPSHAAPLQPQHAMQLEHSDDDCGNSVLETAPEQASPPVAAGGGGGQEQRSPAMDKTAAAEESPPEQALPAQHAPQVAPSEDTPITWVHLCEQAALTQQQVDSLAEARQAALRNNKPLGRLNASGAK